MKREMEPVKKDFRKNVKALLTPEQLEKFKAKHAGKETALDHD
jgi:Spy/CpxP family protein refolding chaperone